MRLGKLSKGAAAPIGTGGADATAKYGVVKSSDEARQKYLEVSLQLVLGQGLGRAGAEPKTALCPFEFERMTRLALVALARLAVQGKMLLTAFETMAEASRKSEIWRLLCY